MSINFKVTSEIQGRLRIARIKGKHLAALDLQPSRIHDHCSSTLSVQIKLTFAQNVFRNVSHISGSFKAHIDTVMFLFLISSHNFDIQRSCHQKMMGREGNLTMRRYGWFAMMLRLRHYDVVETCKILVRQISVRRCSNCEI